MLGKEARPIIHRSIDERSANACVPGPWPTFSEVGMGVAEVLTTDPYPKGQVL